MSYIDGFVIPVPAGKKDAYVAMARAASAVFLEHGATRVVEAWSDSIADGKVTDFKRAVAAEPGEGIVFSWIEYPSKAVRDAASEKVMADPRMKMPDDMPFDMARMIWAGFEPLVDTAA